MLDTDAVISSEDALTGEPITVTVNDHGTTTRWQPTDAVVFLGSRTDCYATTSAESCCGYLNFFTNRHNALAWATAHPEIEGVVLGQRQALEVGLRCFGNLLQNPCWEVQRLLGLADGWSSVLQATELPVHFPVFLPGRCVVSLIGSSVHENPHDKETILRKRVLGVFAGLLATVGSAFGLAASPAAADTIDPWSKCGSDYVVKYQTEIRERQPVVGDPYNVSAVGTLWVMRNRNSDTHCVLTTKKYHTERWTAAGIGYVSESGYRVLDAGNYFDFAGPAYLERNDRTLKAYGRVGDGKVWVRCTTSCWLEDFAYS